MHRQVQALIALTTLPIPPDPIRQHLIQHIIKHPRHLLNKTPVLLQLQSRLLDTRPLIDVVADEGGFGGGEHDGGLVDEEEAAEDVGF